MGTEVIERSWNRKGPQAREKWKTIDDDLAKRELANKHGDDAFTKLAKAKDKTLDTRFAQYRIVDTK